MSERMILVGRVAGAFGVRGEVRITPYTAEPDALLAYRELADEGGTPVLTLLSGRVAGDSLVARARDVETREAAEALRGLRLFIPRSRLPKAEDDEFYLADLIGLAAVAPGGETLGEVKSVQNFGAGDLLEIAPGDGSPSWYAPFTREAVPDVRLADGVVVVLPPHEDAASSTV
jgi:16S rRNA processing protein RimM